MAIRKKDIYNAFTKGLKLFCIMVICIEVVTYTFSFLISGIAKKDIFNILEGKSVTLGIYSVNVLILINTVVPLAINCVKQVNSALVEKLKTRLRCNIKSILLSHVMKTSIDSNKRTEGEILNYYRNECEDIVAYFVEFYSQLPKIVLSISILVVMFFVNPMFAIISLLPTIMMVVLVKVLNKKIYLYRNKSRDNTKEVTSFLNAFFENTEFFYMIVNREQLISLYEKKCHKRSKSEIRDRVLDSLLGSISENSSNIALGIILIIALPFMVAGKFSVGEFVMFGYYYAFLAYMPDAIANLAKRSKQTNASLERINFMFQKENCNDHVTKQNGYNFELVLNGNKKSFYTKEKGIVILEGDRSSTILNSMFLVANRELKDIKSVYVKNEPILFDDSLIDNILMGDEMDDAKINSILERTALIKDIRTFENGLQKRCGKKGENLSGGQIKRVGIARALYQNADVLFIDGITDKVDLSTAKYLIDNVFKGFRGLVILASENNTLWKSDIEIVEV